MRNSPYTKRIESQSTLSRWELLFAKTGGVANIQFLGYYGFNHGHAAVELKSKQLALDCIKRLHGQTFFGHKLSAHAINSKVVEVRGFL